MPSTCRLARAVRHRGLPLNARVGLVRVELARRIRPRAAYALPLGATTILLSHDGYEIDWASLAFVAVDEAYAGDYRGAVVVDIGAHKGYYAAYALEHGARAVVSYEPETANFGLLERAAAAVRAAGRRWDTRQAAVGPEGGEAELHVMGASWGHALQPPEALRPQVRRWLTLQRRRISILEKAQAAGRRQDFRTMSVAYIDFILAGRDTGSLGKAIGIPHPPC